MTRNVHFLTSVLPCSFASAESPVPVMAMLPSSCSMLLCLLLVPLLLLLVVIVSQSQESQYSTVQYSTVQYLLVIVSQSQESQERRFFSFFTSTEFRFRLRTVFSLVWTCQQCLTIDRLETSKLVPWQK